MRILYIHGFNTAGKQNPKTKLMKKLGTVKLITYNSCGSATEIEESLSKDIASFNPDVIIGTSLGGYWSARMASKYSLMSVMINPSRNPQNTMAEHIGSHVNYVTGEEATLTKENVESYDSIRNYTPDGIVLLDSGDEFFDSFKTRDDISDLFCVHIFDGGSHRFDHMKESLELIEEAYVYFYKN